MKAFQEINLSSDIIQGIKSNPEKIMEYLSKEPTDDWVMEGVSEITGEKYKYLSIETLEFLMDNIFEEWSDRITFQNISMNNNSVTVTVSVLIQYSFFESTMFKTKAGTASITVTDNYYFDKEGKMRFYDTKFKRPVKAAQLLNTATPLCLTEAKKNAIKNICNLFGRNLNRETLENVTNETFEETQKISADIIVMKKYENAIKNKDEKTIQEILNNYEINA